MNKKIIKPWGYEILLEKNRKYIFKKLFMKKGHQCSLQFHKKKKETIFVLSGTLKIFMGKKNRLKQRLFKKGNTVTINPGTVHRMFGVTDSIYLEASTPEISDVVRIIDDYNRK